MTSSTTINHTLYPRALRLLQNILLYSDSFIRIKLHPHTEFKKAAIHVCKNGGAANERNRQNRH